MKCSYRSSLEELLERPWASLVLIGADDGDDSSDSDDDDDGDGDDDADGDDDSGDDADDKSKKPSPKLDAKDRRIIGLEEERDRHVAKRKEAETALKAAKTEIAELKKAGTKDEDLKKELSTQETRIAELERDNKGLILNNAFLSDNTYEWLDKDAALKLADLSDVEIDGTKALGMSSALAKLARAKPWLLQVDDDADDDDDTEDKPKVKTGNRPKPKQKNDAASKAAREAALRKKYPSLHTGR